MADDVVVQKLASIEPCLASVAERMRRMVGFRNIAVHEYRRLDPAVVRTVVEYRLDDFHALGRELLATQPARQAAAQGARAIQVSRSRPSQLAQIWWLAPFSASSMPLRRSSKAPLAVFAEHRPWA